MNRSNKILSAVSIASIVIILLTSTVFASQGSEWWTAGGNRQNTRYQQSEHTLSVSNIANLTTKWTFTTSGDVSATPSVDADTVYFPDWAGNLYAVNKLTGVEKWHTSIAAASGVPFDKARATPAITDDKVIIGTQGSVFIPGGGPGGKLLAFNKFTGALVWSTILDDHPVGHGV